MRWEALFADLEAQWASADQLALDEETSERTRIDHAAVTFMDRLENLLGSHVQLRLGAGLLFDGQIVHLGANWLTLARGATSLLVPVRSIVYLDGTGRRVPAPGTATGRPAAAEPAPGQVLDPASASIGRRLSVTAALRALARNRAALTVYLPDGGGAVPVHGVIDRVGPDFFELAVVPPGEARRTPNVETVLTIRFEAVVAILSGVEP